MQGLADQVEAECPFSKTFDIIGRGEGIVWKPGPPLCGKAKFWIKMKGPIITGINVPDKKHATMKEFINAVVSQERLQQGLAYLTELKLKQERGNVSTFLNWIKKDIKKEEKAGIAVWKLAAGPNAKVLDDEIENIAGPWYFSQCKKSG